MADLGPLDEESEDETSVRGTVSDEVIDNRGPVTAGVLEIAIEVGLVVGSNVN